LINGLCAKNGTERPNTCKLLLSLQPRFIARFNQLVSLTSQSWESSKESSGSDEQGEEQGEGEMIHEGFHEGEEYEYEGDENMEGLHEYEEDELVDQVKFQDEAAADAGEEGQEDVLTAAEEAELYDENDESYDPNLQPDETLANQDDVVQVEAYEEHDDREEYEDVQGALPGEEEHHEEQVNITDIPGQTLSVPGEHGTDFDVFLLTNSGNDGVVGNDDDDLISYEEAVDQTEEGQDYRQQYVTEDASTSQDRQQNGQTNDHDYDDETQVVPTNGHDAPPEPESYADRTDHIAVESEVSISKRPHEEVVDPYIEDQAPRKWLCSYISDIAASKRAKSMDR
jgi:hypothetical protein